MNFFQKSHCNQCRKRLDVRITSMFNTDILCMACKEKEEAHPAYERVQNAEHDAVRKGNLNFPGIGLPPDLK